MNWWTWIGYGLGAWVGIAAATAGVIGAGLGRIDRLATQQQPAPCRCSGDLWAEFDRVAVEKGEVW